MKKASFDSFVSQFAKLIEGDDAAAKAEKVFRKAVSGLKSQIATQDSETITLEDNVETAKDALNKARLNHGNLITDISDYVEQLTAAKEDLDYAEAALEDHKAKVDFLKEELANLEGGDDTADDVAAPAAPAAQATA